MSSSGDFEVFLSFRGSDTRQGFTDILYEYLHNAKIRVYRDDDALGIGDKIDSIFGAIDNSKICIPIFSPNFVQSKYCMLEVTKMVELKKTIVPIFYRVTSDDVKLKTSLYSNDFERLEEKYGIHEVNKWKQALKDAVSYKGRRVGVKRYSQFCKEFVHEVISKLRPGELEIHHSDGETNVESVDVASSSREVVSSVIDGMDEIAALEEAVPAAPTISTLQAPVVVLGQDYVASYAVDLTFRKMGELTFYVIDSNGSIIFKVKSPTLKFNSKLLDASGKHTLMTLHHKMFSSTHFTTPVFRGESKDNKDLLFKVKYSEETESGTEYEIHVFLGQNPNEDAWDYTIKGSWWEGSLGIYVGNTNDMVAQITHKKEIKSAEKGEDLFGVRVYPNIDYAFIVALVVYIYAWLS